VPLLISFNIFVALHSSLSGNFRRELDGEEGTDTKFPTNQEHDFEEEAE